MSGAFAGRLRLPVRTFAETSLDLLVAVRPSGRPATQAPVAQRIEHLTTDQKVGGSNPSGCASITASQEGFSAW